MLFGGISIGLQAQEFDANLQLRPRYEYRNGYKTLLPEGSYIVNEGDSKNEGKLSHIGYVTSSYSSSALSRTFALAMVADGRNQIGNFAEVPIGNSVARVEIVDSVFFDKENTRRDG